MRVDIWSDVACPWCYIGKRHFEAALAQFEHADQVTVTWRSFQLDPAAPLSSPLSQNELLAKKYQLGPAELAATQARLTGIAAAADLDYHLDRVRVTNTFDAHRLLHLAAACGLQDALKERLFHAYFTEGAALGDHAVLARLAGEVGLDPAEAAATLVGDGFAHAVRDDEARATSLGIRGVPFFVLDDTFGVSGAQPVAVLLAALRQAWAKTHPLVTLAGSDPAVSCDDESCAV